MRLDHIIYICGVGNTREHGVHGAVVAAEIIEQSAVDKAILIGNEGVSLPPMGLAMISPVPVVTETELSRPPPGASTNSRRDRP